MVKFNLKWISWFSAALFESIQPFNIAMLVRALKWLKIKPLTATNRLEYLQIQLRDKVTIVDKWSPLAIHIAMHKP